MTVQNNTVSFTQMKDGTKEEYELLHELEKPYLAMTADRVLDELRRHGETTLEGYKITRLQHGLQSATRAEADGVDIDWIVGALLHDIGDVLAPQHHVRFYAEVVRPVVRWEVSWVIEHHGMEGINQMEESVRSPFSARNSPTFQMSSAASVPSRIVLVRPPEVGRFAHTEAGRCPARV